MRIAVSCKLCLCRCCVRTVPESYAASTLDRMALSLRIGTVLMLESRGLQARVCRVRSVGLDAPPPVGGEGCSGDALLRRPIQGMGSLVWS